MKTRKVISGVTFSGFATEPPSFPGLAAFAFLGTAKDGINTNRAPGGPAFSNTGTGPTATAANFATFNGTSGVDNGIDSGVVETSAIATSGFTWLAVARMFGSGAGPASLVNIGTVNNLQFGLVPQDGLVSSHPTLTMTFFGDSSRTADNEFDLGAGTDITKFRFYALTFPGGTGAYTFYDVTAGTTRTTTKTQARAGNASNHMTFGNHGGNAWFASMDMVAGGIWTQPLNLTQLQAFRTWLLGPLAARGITGA